MTKHKSTFKSLPKSTSKPSLKPTTNSTAESKSAKSNFMSTSSSSRGNSRELVPNASTSMDSTTSPIILKQNATKVKASTVFKAMIVDKKATILVESTATPKLAEPDAIETSINTSIAPEKKATGPAPGIPSTAEATFELFPKLPAELRLQIWKLVPAPRLVVVYYHIDGRKRGHKFAASLPVTLRACQESRHEALKIYHRAFDSKWALNGAYFNFKIDTLVLNYAMPKQREHFLRNIKPKDLSCIERITLNCGELGTVPRLVGLKEVIYTGHPCYNRNHTHISSCSTGDGSIHTRDELIKFNPDKKMLCLDMKMAQLRLSKIKKRFEESEEGTKISIRLGYLCMRGMPEEDNSFYFK